MRKARFLIVSPHPDDAELGIGGTILKLKAQGHRVYIVDVTNGEPTPYGTVGKRKKETAMASRILKPDGRVNLGLPNRYCFDTKDARLLLAEKIRVFKPDIIFAPSLQDAHPDHVAARRIAEAARFYAKYTKIDLKGKPHYPRYLFYYFCSHSRALPPVSFLVDISAHINNKMRAMRCYRSQFIDNPGNRFIFDYVKDQNKYLGNLIGCKYAEALFSKEMIRINDLACLL